MVENGQKPTTGGKIADEDIELNEAEIVAYFASGIEFFKERMTFKGNLQRFFPYLVSRFCEKNNLNLKFLLYDY